MKPHLAWIFSIFPELPDRLKVFPDGGLPGANVIQQIGQSLIELSHSVSQKSIPADFTIRSHHVRTDHLMQSAHLCRYHRFIESFAHCFTHLIKYTRQKEQRAVGMPASRKTSLTTASRIKEASNQQLLHNNSLKP
jgi:hypothetical protein